MTTLTLAMASLRHRRLRATVGVASIALACAMLCLSLSATERVRSALSGFDPSSVIILSPRGGLTSSVANRIRSHLAGNGDVQWNRQLGGQTADKRLGFAVFAVSDGYLSSYPPPELDVPLATRQAWLADRQGVIVTSDLLSRAGWKVGDEVSWTTGFGTVQSHISGKSTGAVSNGIFPHFEYIDALVPDKGRLSTITVHHTTDTDKVITDLDDMLGAELPVLVMRERAMHARIIAVSGALPNLLGKIAFVFAVSTLLVILSNAFVSLRERRTEFGALRAMGFRRGRIMGLVVAEFVTTAVLAGLLGCGVPWLLWREHGVHLGELALANVTLAAPICLAVMAGTLVLGSVVTLVPALLLVRTSTISLLEPQ